MCVLLALLGAADARRLSFAARRRRKQLDECRRSPVLLWRGNNVRVHGVGALRRLLGEIGFESWLLAVRLESAGDFSRAQSNRYLQCSPLPRFLRGAGRCDCYRESVHAAWCRGHSELECDPTGAAKFPRIRSPIARQDHKDASLRLNPTFDTAREAK